jgi:hypothetical protein
METPMVTDLKKLRDFDSDLVESSMYRQLIRSLMYLARHLFCCEHVETVPSGT